MTLHSYSLKAYDFVCKYLNLRLKTYGKRYTEMIAHKNLPLSRHELTKKDYIS